MYRRLRNRKILPAGEFGDATLHSARMNATPRLIGDSVNILDLNDDCLKEVFAHMDPTGLGVVADVCVRFRQNSMHSARSKCTKLELSVESFEHDYSMMRNFGAFIEKIEVDGSRIDESRAEKYLKRSIELLSRYCVGTYIDLTLYNMNSVFVGPKLMRYGSWDILERVQKLQLNHFHRKFLEDLSFSARKLRELNFYGTGLPFVAQRQTQFLYNIQKLPNLVSISFNFCHSGISGDTEEFLKKNPQLKQAEFIQSNGSFFRSFVAYVPKIERIKLEMMYPINSYIAKCFGRLRELKSLELIAHDDHYFVLKVIHEIAAANIALECLKLVGFNLDFYSASASKFIEEISKLQHMKTLHLRRVRNLTAAHLIEMCERSNGLLEIVLDQYMSMTENELLTLVRNGKNLQKLDWSAEDGNQLQQVSIIDAGIFKKIKAITEQRGEKLTLQLPALVFTADIPEELISAARGVLSLEIR